MMDISLPLKRGIINYPGDADYEEFEYFTHELNHVHIMRVLMETHSGTHFDAPYHMIPTGKKANEIPLENFLGEATLIEVKGDIIEPEHIPDDPTEILLFKTKNSELYDTFHKDFTYLSLAAAKKIITKRVKLIGIDYLSIEKFGSPEPVVHKTLMSKDIIIVEGLIFKNISPGKYEFICLPLNMSQDGAPCRAVLREKND
ncbi:cyclase family protein [Cuniculiplasma sp. SKW4]|uniref:cyclase family protein n=1 Tax=Cuniculiplasma sp. SKW4 TaxID=3400171 RepID=UPI003FD396D8